jgi:uncharacterized protein YecT (DUF1311 family)
MAIKNVKGMSACVLGLLVLAGGERAMAATDQDVMRMDLNYEDQRLNRHYQEAVELLDAGQRQQLRMAQREWLAWRDRECKSAGKVGNHDDWIEAVIADRVQWECVVAATAARATELRREIAGVRDTQYPSRFNPYSRNRKRTVIHRNTGKWYYEVTWDVGWIARTYPGTTVFAGFVSDLSPTGLTMKLGSRGAQAGKERWGLALDLDNGHSYFSEDGHWQGGAPGSGRGEIIKTGYAYGARAFAYEHGNELLTSGAFVTNFGDESFGDPLPPGYRAWRDQTCDDPQNSRETALCLDQELRASDQLINQSYQRLMESLDTAERARLKLEQQGWIEERDRSCMQSNTTSGDREAWYRQLLRNTPLALCVTRLSHQRDAELQQLLLPPAERGKISMSQGSTTQARNFLDYQTLAGVKRSSGKWYFEVTVQRSGIAGLRPTEFTFGCGEFTTNTAATFNMKVTRMDEQEAPLTLGFLVDLNDSRLYGSEFGRWVHGVPGSQDGLLLKRGGAYDCGVHSSENMRDLEQRGLIDVNFGVRRKFMFEIPEGAKAFGSK